MVLQPRVNTVAMKVVVALGEFFDVLLGRVGLKAETALDPLAQQPPICAYAVAGDQVQNVVGHSGIIG